ncbi:hypothetical protein MUP07_10610 [Candidatus Bathyarchaeota archaeon]|jgi:hypothetical protein|nr:hypothetical protein [Candidatus Bathyarchaeota archaeon]
MTRVRTFAIIAIGVLGTLVSILSMNASFLRDVFLLVFSLMALAGVLDWLADAVSLSSSWSILRTCKRLGIKRIHETPGGQTMSRHIEKSRIIRIMAVSAQSLIKSHKRAIVTSLRDNSAHVMILLATPRSEFVADLEKSESSSRMGQISPEIEQVERLLSECAQEASAARQHGTVGAVDIGHYRTHLRCSLVLCDDSWGWITLNLAPKRAVELVSFELCSMTTGTGLLADCTAHFDRVWSLIQAENGVRRIT